MSQYFKPLLLPSIFFLYQRRYWHYRRSARFLCRCNKYFERYRVQEKVIFEGKPKICSDNKPASINNIFGIEKCVNNKVKHILFFNEKNIPFIEQLFSIKSNLRRINNCALELHFKYCFSLRVSCTVYRFSDFLIAFERDLIYKYSS